MKLANSFEIPSFCGPNVSKEFMLYGGRIRRVLRGEEEKYLRFWLDTHVLVKLGKKEEEEWIYAYHTLHEFSSTTWLQLEKEASMRRLKYLKISALSGPPTYTCITLTLGHAG